MRTAIKTLLLLLIITIIGAQLSCKHNPVLGDDTDPNPADTTSNPVDTTMTGTPCTPGVIYFEKDVLPILKSNCAFSGCHDAISAADGIKLDSYDNVMKTGKVKPGKPGDSEIYEVITEGKDKDRMPPPPAPRLSAEQIAVIAGWITQGAKKEMCDETAAGCTTTNISYSSFVSPLLKTNCVGCHNAVSAGGGIKLEFYTDVKAAALSGKLFGSINQNPGFVAMPQGSNKLSACNISKIKSWIDAGALNN